MSTQNNREDIIRLRLLFQRNSRMRLEFLADLSRLLREHDELIEDDLLRKIVVAIPEELPGESFGDPGGREFPTPPAPPDDVPPQPAQPGGSVPPQPAPQSVPPQPAPPDARRAGAPPQSVPPQSVPPQPAPASVPPQRGRAVPPQPVADRSEKDGSTSKQRNRAGSEKKSSGTKGGKKTGRR